MIRFAHDDYNDEFDQCDDCGYERGNCGCVRFADPGGRSALRAGKRNKPCPTCGGRNRLTAEDVSLGYQCDSCADRLERGYD